MCETLSNKIKNTFVVKNIVVGGSEKRGYDALFKSMQERLGYTYLG